MIQDKNSGREYAGVLVRAGNSPMYRLKAPDNTTVKTYDGKPSSEQAKQDLLANGYEIADAHVPIRDMRIDSERLPDDLTVN